MANIRDQESWSDARVQEDEGGVFACRCTGVDSRTPCVRQATQEDGLCDECRSVGDDMRSRLGPGFEDVTCCEGNDRLVALGVGPHYGAIFGDKVRREGRVMRDNPQA